LELIPDLSALKSKLPPEIHSGDEPFLDVSSDKIAELRTEVRELLIAKRLQHGGGVRQLGIPTEPPWYVIRMPGGVGGGESRGSSLSRLCFKNLRLKEQNENQTKIEKRNDSILVFSISCNFLLSVTCCHHSIHYEWYYKW
jgi:hypothetical protein